MSIECGECERDLRGGHERWCSRYNVMQEIADEEGDLDRGAAKDLSDWIRKHARKDKL